MHHVFYLRSCWRRLGRSGPIGWWSYSTAFSVWTRSRSPSLCWAPSCPTSSQTLLTGTAWQIRPEKRWPSKRSLILWCWCCLFWDAVLTLLFGWPLRLSVWCALSSYSSHHKGSFSARQRKRQREDIEVKLSWGHVITLLVEIQFPARIVILRSSNTPLSEIIYFWPQDYNSLFPLDDTQPSKLMRLLSSNEDEPVALSSPGQSINVWFLIHCYIMKPANALLLVLVWAGDYKNTRCTSKLLLVSNFS